MWIPSRFGGVPACLHTENMPAWHLDNSHSLQKEILDLCKHICHVRTSPDERTNPSGCSCEPLERPGRSFNLVTSPLHSSRLGVRQIARFTGLSRLVRNLSKARRISPPAKIHAPSQGHPKARAVACCTNLLRGASIRVNQEC